jgi:hypothetical protein
MSLIQEKSACYSSLLIRRSLSPLGEIPKKNATNPKWTPYQAPTSNHAYLSSTFDQNISDFFDLYLHWVSVVKDSYMNGQNTSTMIFWKSETSRDIRKSFEHPLNIFKSCVDFQNEEGMTQTIFFLIYLLV